VAILKHINAITITTSYQLAEKRTPPNFLTNVVAGSVQGVTDCG